MRGYAQDAWLQTQVRTRLLASRARTDLVRLLAASTPADNFPTEFAIKLPPLEFRTRLRAMAALTYLEAFCDNAEYAGYQTT